MIDELNFINIDKITDEFEMLFNWWHNQMSDGFLWELNDNLKEGLDVIE